MHTRAIALALALVAQVSTAAPAAANLAGLLDPTFGAGGRVMKTFPVGARRSATAVAIQPDGKIVVAGTVPVDFSRSSIALARFLSDGSLDSGFGSGGLTLTAIGPGMDEAFAVLLQSDGKIVVGGSSERTLGGSADWDLALVRYDQNGALDPSFGTGGAVRTDVGGFDHVPVQ